MMDLLDLAHSSERLLDPSRRLVRLNPRARTVFIGDIHGDLDAVERVLSLISESDTVGVFLGDVVDRGPRSRECLERILCAKLERPEAVTLLMGNHEAWSFARFRPADFWESLAMEEASELGRILLKLPLAAWHPSGVLALHGAIPDLARLEDVARISLGDATWRDVTWGDWMDSPGSGSAPLSGRPVHGPREFSARSTRLGVRALVRSHQPDAPLYLFDDRCLTLFTSHAYGEGPRRVAILAGGGSIETARDLDLVEI